MSEPNKFFKGPDRMVVGTKVGRDLERLEADLNAANLRERLKHDARVGLRVATYPFANEIVGWAVELYRAGQRANAEGDETGFKYDVVRYKKSVPARNRIGIGTSQTVTVDMCEAQWSSPPTRDTTGDYSLRWSVTGNEADGVGLMEVSGFRMAFVCKDINEHYLNPGEEPEVIVEAELKNTDPDDLIYPELNHRLTSLKLIVDPAVTWDREAPDSSPYQLTTAKLNPALEEELSLRSLTPYAIPVGELKYGLEKIAFAFNFELPKFSRTHYFRRTSGLAPGWDSRTYDFTYNFDPKDGGVFECQTNTKMGEWNGYREMIPKEELFRMAAIMTRPLKSE